MAPPWMLTFDTSPPAHVPCCEDLRAAVARLRRNGRHRARTVPYRRPDELKPARWDNAHQNGHLDSPACQLRACGRHQNSASAATLKRSGWALANGAARCYEGSVGGADSVRFFWHNFGTLEGDERRHRATDGDAKELNFLNLPMISGASGPLRRQRSYVRIVSGAPDFSMS